MNIYDDKCAEFVLANVNEQVAYIRALVLSSVLKACCHARKGSCTADLLEGVKAPCGARVQKLCLGVFSGAVASSACHDTSILTDAFLAGLDCLMAACPVKAGFSFPHPWIWFHRQNAM